MRFEIKAGGVFVIVLGLVALSAFVFFMGATVGRVIFQANQPEPDQISTTLPLPNPPEAEATATAPAAEASAPSAVASRAVAAAPAIAPVARASAAAPIAAISAAAQASPAAVARIRPPETAPAMNPPPPAPGVAEEGEPAAAPSPPVAAAAAAPHGKPFNIQIEAVMDKSGADEMIARLKALGYNAQAVKTLLGGETWYRVRVGPYDTEEQARAAQEQLRQQYKQKYTTSH